MKGDDMMEDIKVTGDRLVDTVKKLLKEGNVRHITVKNNQGKVVFEVPLTLGLVGVAVAPMVAALGTVASLLADCTITVQRDPDQ